MLGKKKDGFKPGELEKLCDKIASKEKREQKRLGFDDETYGRYTLERNRYETAKNAMRTIKKEYKK